MSWSSRKKKGHFLYCLFYLRNLFFNICILSQCIVYWIHFQNIHTFTYQKALLHRLMENSYHSHMEGMDHLFGPRSILLNFSTNLFIRVLLRWYYERPSKGSKSDFLSYRATLILSEKVKLSHFFRGNKTKNFNLFAC